MPEKGSLHFLVCCKTEIDSHTPTTDASSSFLKITQALQYLYIYCVYGSLKNILA